MLISNKPLNYFWVSLTLFFNEIMADTNIVLKSDSSKIRDVPSHKDLRVYLISLERIINFAVDYKDDLDLNFGFGLFLVNVNLKPFFVDDTLSVLLRNYIKSLLERNDYILDLYNDGSGRDGNYGNHLLKISTFFKNSSSWLKRLQELNFELSRRSGFQFNKNQEYPDWRTYVKKVDDIDKWEPSPQQSDFCMASLADTEENRSEHPIKCRVPENCYKILTSGTNFGYGLTHRLLFLVFARFGRGCTVFSTAQDQNLRHRFCQMIYTEAEYIASNGYRHVDLMFEQIALCSLDGHAEFLRRSWLYNLLRYQTPHGCFGQQLPSHGQRLSTLGQQYQNAFKDSEEVNWKHDIMNRTCNGHVTAVAAASIAAAVRSILENY